ncbi:MAG: hypothetical protein JWM59_2862 [Verrucomicrobiales bacterium]|nr:hypothetical protein [Verrucomicrobiales bacterium]
MNMSSLHLFLCAGAGLFTAFGAGMWAGIRTVKRDTVVTAAAGHKPEMLFQESTGNRNGGLLDSPGPAKPPGGGVMTAGGLDLAGLTPEDAWRRLSTMSNGTARREAVIRLLKSLPADQWLPWLSAVTHDIGDVPDGSDPGLIARMFSTVDDVLSAAAAAGPEKALKTGSLDNPAAALLAAKWAAHDPAAAAAWFEGVLSATDSPPPGGDRTAEAMAAMMARQNPAEALAWAEALPAAGGVRDAALSGAIKEALKTDPGEAGRVLTLYGGGVDDRGPLAARVAAALAERDPRAALAWAVGAEAGMRPYALPGALERWVERDFDSVFSAVKGLEGEAASWGLSTILKKTPPERFPEVAALLETQPAEGEGRAAASGELMRVWTDRSPEEASAWMSRQPPGPVRDEAISTFVEWAGANDPEAAFMWAASVSSPGTRKEALDDIISRLGEKAPEAVEAWLATNPALPQEERERVRGKAGGGGQR